MKTFNTLILAVAIGSCASAEMRMWTDESGNRFKGEFDKELFGDIRVKGEDRKSHMIPMDKLVKEDWEYILNKVPPRIEASVSKSIRKKPEMDWTIEQDVTQLYTFKVTLTKTSRLPYKGVLTAELFLFGDEVDGDNYVLVHREKTDFTFPDARDSIVEYQVADIHYRKYYASWAVTESRFRGIEYIGYLLAVSDSDGKLVYTDCDVADSDWITGDIEKSLEGLRKIAYDGRGSVYSRHFNKRFRKVMVPRIPWHKRTQWF
ncbi:MAG: hypothetical protein AB7E95_03430 [Kiritimatiellales bacterium]